MTNLSFFFDYSCPYAYLGSLGVEALAARTGAQLSFEPFLLGGVFRAQGTPQKLFATLSPAKAKHNADDLARWAAHEGATLIMPAEHPFRTVEALRATLLTGCDPKVIHGFFRAYWVENRDLSHESTLRNVLTQAGHDASAILPRLAEAKPDLIARTDRAIALGVFGAPTYVVNDELYWGQDRVHQVEQALTGKSVPLPGTPRQARNATKPHRLEVFFDFSSPFAYLGIMQVEALVRRTGAEVIYKPMLLGGLFRAIGQVDVPLAGFPEAKQRYVAKDMDRWAKYWSTPFRFPSRFPTNSIKALRMYLALPEEARGAFRDAVFRAYWAQDLDIADEGVLAGLAGPLGDAARARMASPEVKDALRLATEEAQARGVFGAPTFIVDGEHLYWGQDRLGLVEAALTRAEGA